MDVDRLLERLREPDGEAVRGLARVLEDHALATPWATVLEPRWVAERLVDAASLMTARPAVRDLVVRIVEEARAELATVEQPARTWVPEEAHAALDRLLRLRWSPSEELTFRVINHPATRTMLKEVLTGTLTRFAQKMRSLDHGVLGGLGGRAMARGRGLLGGGLGAAAESLVGAVRDEFEAALDGRVREFVGTASDEAVRTIARWIADPAHADLLGSMRVASAEVLLDTPVRDLVAELRELDAGAIADVLLEGTRALAAREDAVDLLVPHVRRALDALGDDTLGGWLDELDARDAWHGALSPVITRQLHHLAASEAFGTWLRSLS